MRPSFGDSLETAVDANRQGMNEESRTRSAIRTEHELGRSRRFIRRGQSREQRWARTRFGRRLGGAESASSPEVPSSRASLNLALASTSARTEVARRLRACAVREHVAVRPKSKSALTG